MSTRTVRPACRRTRTVLALLCAALLAPGGLFPVVPGGGTAAAQEAAPKIPDEQLDALVAPIALYPDPLLSQTLVASTYPVEIVQLQQWLQKNKNLKGKELEDALMKQGWDPSIQAMAVLPDVVKRLADDVKWTTDLGNAFLAQQEDVMNAVQRMRKKAQDAGALKTTEQQKVETKVVEQKTVIIVEQTNPQVVYVPVYNPVVVYGAPVYPYPPIYYPPPPPPGAYAASVAVAFGVGVAVGAAYHGGWGYGCGWGHNDVEVNVNNNYQRNYNNQQINKGNRPSTPAAGNKWQHNPQHRGGTPYSNKAVATKYGGTTRGDSMSARRDSARQQTGQAGGRPQAGTMDRGAGSRPEAGAADRGAGGRGQAGAMDRDAGSRPQAGAMDRGGGDRPQAGSMDRGAGASSRGTGGDRIGGRDVSPGGGGRDSSAFGGASGGLGGGAARSSSQRGASSLGGGGARGGGGGGGGGRGGRGR